jgi:hypothetical protein
LANNEDLDTSQLAQCDAQAKALKYAANLTLQMPFDCARLEAGDCYCTYLWNTDLTVPIDHGTVVDIDIAPSSDV